MAVQFMEGPPLLALLFDNNNAFYFTDSKGILQKSNTPQPVRLSPDGLKDVAIINERNRKYWGLDRSFTIPLKWVADGAQIIKEIYYTYGPYAGLNMMLLEQNLVMTATEYEFVYTKIYVGQPDLTTFVHEGPSVTCSVIDGGAAKMIKANENVIYELTFDQTAQDVFIDGIPLQETGNLNLVPDLVIKTDEAGVNILPPISYTTSDGQSTGVTFASTLIQSVQGQTFAQKIKNLNWFARNTADQDISIRITGRLLMRCLRNDTQTSYRLRILTSDMVLQDQEKYALPDSVTVGQPGFLKILNVDITIVLRPGENALLELIFSDAGPISGVEMQFETGSNLRAEFFNKYPGSNVKTMSLWSAFQQLVSKATDGKYKPVSALLQAEAGIRLASGDSVRRLEGAVLKTSISDFFDAMNLIPKFGPIGMGCPLDVVTLEKLEYWIGSEATQIDLGSVSSFKHSAAKDYMFGTIRVGYEEKSYDNVNGRQEFNNSYVFTTPAKETKEELTLISPYRADSYGIEFMRARLDGKTTTDSTSDNDVILLATDGAGKLDRTLNAGATGIISPDGVFNISLSPKRMIIAQGPIIRAGLRGLEGQWLVFQTTEKNSKLVAGGVTESANVMIGDLKTPLFWAEMYDFECPPPVGNSKLLLATSLRRYKFTYNGVTLYGIPLRSGMQPGAERTQVYQLLATPEVDFTTEIPIDQ